jgi:hypothetical protein
MLRQNEYLPWQITHLNHALACADTIAAGG